MVREWVIIAGLDAPFGNLRRCSCRRGTNSLLPQTQVPQDTFDHLAVVDQRHDAHLLLALGADPPTLKLRTRERIDIPSRRSAVALGRRRIDQLAPFGGSAFAKPTAGQVECAAAGALRRRRHEWSCRRRAGPRRAPACHAAHASCCCTTRNIGQVESSCPGCAGDTRSLTLLSQLLSLCQNHVIVGAECDSFRGLGRQYGGALQLVFPRHGEVLRDFGVRGFITEHFLGVEPGLECRRGGHLPGVDAADVIGIGYPLDQVGPVSTRVDAEAAESITYLLHYWFIETDIEIFGQHDQAVGGEGAAETRRHILVGTEMGADEEIPHKSLLHLPVHDEGIGQFVHEGEVQTATEVKTAGIENTVEVEKTVVE